MRHIPSCPVKVNFPSPPIRVASTNMISPPMAVHAKPEEKMRTKIENTGLKNHNDSRRYCVVRDKIGNQFTGISKKKDISS